LKIREKGKEVTYANGSPKFYAVFLRASRVRITSFNIYVKMIHRLTLFAFFIIPG